MVDATGGSKGSAAARRGDRQRQFPLPSRLGRHWSEARTAIGKLPVSEERAARLVEAGATRSAKTKYSNNNVPQLRQAETSFNMVLHLSPKVSAGALQTPL